MAKFEWVYSKVLPPSWVVDAFCCIQSPPISVAKNIGTNIQLFKRHVVPVIEASLQGTQDKLNAVRILSADEQRATFFIHVVECADYFRPISAEDKITRAVARDDLDQQKSLRTQISDQAKALANLVKQHCNITRRLGVSDGVENDLFDLINDMERLRDRRASR